MATTTNTIDRPGATIVYDVRENQDSDRRPLMFIGQPMGASDSVVEADPAEMATFTNEGQREIQEMAAD